MKSQYANRVPTEIKIRCPITVFIKGFGNKFKKKTNATIL